MSDRIYIDMEYIIIKDKTKYFRIPPYPLLKIERLHYEEEFYLEFIELLKGLKKQ